MHSPSSGNAQSGFCKKFTVQIFGEVSHSPECLQQTPLLVLHNPTVNSQSRICSNLSCHLQYSLEYTVIQRRYAHIVLIGCTRAYLIRCYTVMIHTLYFDLIHSLMIMHMMMMTRIDNLYNTYTVKLERYSGAYTYVQ